MNTPLPAYIVLNGTGEALAGRLADATGGEVHGLANRTAAPDVAFADTLLHIRALFMEGRPVIGICAAGILVRAVAPVLADKRNEPPVLAVAEDGSAVVPVLGGHRGANRLAREIAGALGIDAAVTTAGDVGLGFALDEPPAGWRIADPANAKPVMAAMLNGDPVWIDRDDHAPAPDWLNVATTDDAAAATIRVTDSAADDGVVIHPQVLCVGVGCERDCDPAEVEMLVTETLASAGLARGAVACVVSVDLKSDEPAVLAMADSLGVPARFFDAQTLEKETPRLKNPSDVVFAEVGCHGVAEGAALAAAGADGVLVVEKHKSARATCAIARAPLPVDLAAIGRARGRLSIVGIGPGQASWRTPEVSAWLAEATDVVGYGLYLDLLGNAIAGKERHMSELSEEEARVRRSIELAAEGREVALVSSGDAGIYAMAALAFEVLDRDDTPTFNRVDVRVSPGISAVQAAAARIGAPLGHDFALISLSDLLTPWEVIEKRITAAAMGDFTVAFYNPVSKRRRTQLATAKEILLKHRPGDVPVVLARNLGREEEDVRVITLSALEVDMVDMLTLVLVGSSATRHIKRGMREWVYTPRGYEAKLAGE
ncbi:MAG: precorrin-3B C(17)-methyltransferase [Rhodospirillales bacterium]|nr:precorrin-3B C(17)-methyltransferase [Rhodospirillales bacterium]MBO6788433.1 precorrin-3B C(17)-methyltransferase [Rhodospirillales bacterium]